MKAFSARFPLESVNKHWKKGGRAVSPSTRQSCKLLMGHIINYWAVEETSGGTWKHLFALSACVRKICCTAGAVRKYQSQKQRRRPPNETRIASITHFYWRLPLKSTSWSAIDFCTTVYGFLRALFCTPTIHFSYLSLAQTMDFDP